jgi:hypothetical protein
MIAKGSDKLKAYVGSTGVDKMYIGSTLVYSAEQEEPIPYQRVAYLAMTGTQWINTGLTFNGINDFEFLLDIAPTRFYDYNAISCIGTATTNESWIGSTGNYLYRQSKKRSSGVAVTLNKRVKLGVVFNGSSYILYRDGVQITSSTCTAVTSSSPLWLFHRKMYAEAKVYRVKIWKNGELVMDLQPVVDNNVGYFYDSVGEALVSNSGTGDFVLPD